MGKRGPQKEPTAALEKRGSWRAKLPERQNEIKVAALLVAPEPPEWLTEPAKSLWREHAQPAFAEGLLTSMDVMAFGFMCQRLADYYEAKALGDRRGMDEAAKSAIQCMDRCGMNVTSRVGLPKPESKPKGAVVEARTVFAKG